MNPKALLKYKLSLKLIQNVTQAIKQVITPVTFFTRLDEALKFLLVELFRRHRHVQQVNIGGSWTLRLFIYIFKIVLDPIGV